MTRITSFFALLAGSLFGGCNQVPAETLAALPASVDQVPFTLMDGSETTLSAMDGKAFLLVNVASECGFTSQYGGLQALHQQFSPDGLVVIGFPANDFLGQEPGTNDEIVQFCQMNFGVDFPLAQKISVKGEEIHPLYAFLTSPETNPDFAGAISWNFNKFLVAGDGKILARFGSSTAPQDPELVASIKTALAQ